MKNKIRSLVLIMVMLIGIGFSCSSDKGKDDSKSTLRFNSGSDVSEIESKLDQTEIWELLQDSLRTELLHSKSEQNLKSTLLEELYIRGLVDVRQNKYRLELPFDLHGFDCSAPDCFSTEIVLEIPISNPIYFPRQVQFQLQENGCIDEKIYIKGTFELKEETAEYINYYSKKERSNLLIFGEDERQEYVYYFVGVDEDAIQGKSIGKLLESYNEEDPESNAPYRITTMLIREYSYFF